MSTGKKIGISMIALSVLIMIVSAASWLWARDYGNRTEHLIEAAHKDLKQSFAMASAKIVEIAQVPAMQRDDIIKSMTAQLEARYGQDGSEAVFQVLKEQNIAVSDALYLSITQEMRARRDDMAIRQRRFIDITNGYETTLGSWYSGFWLRRASYPKITLTDFKILTTQEVEKAFETGIDAPIQLR